MNALDCACELIEFPSVSSVSNLAITDCLEARLRSWGFEIERVDYNDPHSVPKANLIARLGEGAGGLALAGHSDVVPASNWRFSAHGPFQPVVREGRLYGRGSTDMKGPVAAMLTAIDAVRARPLREPIYFCCTADEEVGMLGAEHLARNSQLYRDMVEGQTRCVVGEPTGLEVIHGHKGGCGLVITARGRAQHSSLGSDCNANWTIIPFLQEMHALRNELEVDPRYRNELFTPPTMCLNLGVNDHNPALNITAAQSVCTLYFRAMPGVDTDPVLERIRSAAAAHGLEFEMTFRATPFFVAADSPFVQECLQFATAPAPRTVPYGTDAARFGELKNLVVMGPGHIAQAHTQDEFIALDHLQAGARVYQRMLERWCVAS